MNQPENSAPNATTLLRDYHDAQLVLEDGRVFRGRRFGAQGDAIGEVVFNTCMTGYQEILTDPSYAGQIVVMTSSQIGNYGVAADDDESRSPFLTGLIVKEASPIASNWRAVESLHAHLSRLGVVGLEGIDTRSLVRHLRMYGAKRGIITPIGASPDQLTNRCAAHPTMAGADLASSVTSSAPYEWNRQRHFDQPNVVAPILGSDAPPLVVVIDYGVKWNILRSLYVRGYQVRVVPARTDAESIRSLNPTGVLLSNGPGDPEPLEYTISTIRTLLGRVPIGGICLGHQLLALAAGGRTYKMKFGHRGGNHPVIDLRTQAVLITSHNHGFSVDADSLPKGRVRVTHLNLNDNSVEGLAFTDIPAIGVQYHPEAAPGPHDAEGFFDEFTHLMRLKAG